MIAIIISLAIALLFTFIFLTGHANAARGGNGKDPLHYLMVAGSIATIAWCVFYYLTHK